MKLAKRKFIQQSLVGAFAVTALFATTSPSRAQAPSAEEIKTIAEEAFIYGLPLVMNYAVMYEYAVDTKSSQFKAPFNEITNMHRVATYEDTAVITPNSDTPYSVGFLDLRADPIVLWVAAGVLDGRVADGRVDRALPDRLPHADQDAGGRSPARPEPDRSKEHGRSSPGRVRHAVQPTAQADDQGQAH